MPEPEIARVCPACQHAHPDADCVCGCEFDMAFCGTCGWLDRECPRRPAMPETSAAVDPMPNIFGNEPHRRPDTERTIPMNTTLTVSPAAQEHAKHRLDGLPDNLRCLCDQTGKVRFADESAWHEHVAQAVIATVLRFIDFSADAEDCNACLALDDTCPYHATEHTHNWGPWQRRRPSDPDPNGGVRSCPCGAVQQTLNVDGERDPIVETTACPDCGAEKKVPCRTVIDGEDTGWTHDARVFEHMGVRPVGDWRSPELPWGVGWMTHIDSADRPVTGDNEPDCTPARTPIRCATRCSQWPNCQHDWTAWEAGRD